MGKSVNRMDVLTLVSRKEGTPLKIVTFSGSMLSESLDQAFVVILREKEKQARKLRDNYVDKLLGYRVVYHSDSNYFGDYYWEKILWDEYLEAERIAEKCHDAYRRARKYLSALKEEIKRVWLRRIRFAGRAIGNMWDYSLEMLATPPTKASVDEYFDVCDLNIHQRGGALVGSLA